MERSKRSLNVRMKHGDDDGGEQGTNLSHSVCKESVKGQRH